MGNPDTKRCFACRKKISLAEQTMACKCSYVFCGSHRQPETHSCSFDFKESGMKDLEKKLLEGKPSVEKVTLF